MSAGIYESATQTIVAGNAAEAMEVGADAVLVNTAIARKTTATISAHTLKSFMF